MQGGAGRARVYVARARADRADRATRPFAPPIHSPAPDASLCPHRLSRKRSPRRPAHDVLLKLVGT